MYTSPYLVSRGAEEIRREQRRAITRDRLAARAAGARQPSLSGVVTAANAAVRFLHRGLVTQPVGRSRGCTEVAWE